MNKPKPKKRKSVTKELEAYATIIEILEPFSNDRRIAIMKALKILLGHDE